MDATWTEGYGHDGNKTSSMYSTNSKKENVRYAGFWMRFWAYLIDAIVIFSIKGLLLSPLAFVPDHISLQIGFWTWDSILGACIFYLYFFVMTKTFQQTVGKMIIGIKVIKENHSQLTIADLLFREVIGRMIYNIIGILKLLYIVIGFTNEKQGLHDMIGNTRVIHVDK